MDFPWATYEDSIQHANNALLMHTVPNEELLRSFIKEFGRLGHGRLLSRKQRLIRRVFLKIYYDDYLELPTHGIWSVMCAWGFKAAIRH